MDKKKRFVLATILITACYYVSHFAPYDWHYQAIFALTLFAQIYFLLLFLKLSKKLQDAFSATILPTLFILGISLFYFLFSQSLIWRLVLTAIFALGVYALLLIENVFLVSGQFKVVPLYRAASTVGLILSLTTGFFLFDVLLSFRLSAWMNFLFVFIICFALFRHFLWIVDLSAPDSGKNIHFVATLSLIMGEIALILSFWPVGVTKGSLYLVSLLYLFGGLSQTYRSQKLFKKTLLEFIWISLGVFLALISSTSWRG